MSSRASYIRNRQQLLILFGLFTFSFVLYATTMSRGITWLNNGQDGGDFISAARAFGVPHPTGYPTYTLLLRLFGDVVAVGSHAFRANLLSVLTGALTVPFVYVAAFRLISSLPGRDVGGGLSVRVSAVVAAVAFATSRLFWTQNTITEVYSLNALFGAVLLVLALGVVKDLRTGGMAMRNRVLISFLFGIGLGNHTTLGLAVLPFAIWVLWVVWQQGRWWAVFDWRPAVGLLAGLSIYAYPSIAASADPLVNWGAADTLEGFRWMATATIYQNYAFGLESDFLSGRISKTIQLLFTQYTIAGTVIGIAGLTTIWTHSREFVVVSVASILAIAVYSVSYSTPDSFIYLISAFMVFSLWLGVGVALLGTEMGRYVGRTKRFSSRVKQVRVGVVVLVVLVIPGWSVVGGWSEIDISGDDTDALYSEMAVAEATGGILFAEEPQLFALVYQAQVANPELDVMVVGPSMLQHDWYWDSLAKFYGNRIPSERPASFLQRFEWVVGLNVGRIPIYATHDDRFYYEGFTLVPDGDLFRVEF